MKNIIKFFRSVPSFRAALFCFNLMRTCRHARKGFSVQNDDILSHSEERERERNADRYDLNNEIELRFRRQIEPRKRDEKNP